MSTPAQTLNDFLGNLVANQQSTVHLLDWMTDLLVNPKVKPATHLALSGPPGCGKGIFVNLLRQLLGDGAVHDGTSCDIRNMFKREGEVMHMIQAWSTTHVELA